MADKKELDRRQRQKMGSTDYKGTKVALPSVPTGKNYRHDKEKNPASYNLNEKKRADRPIPARPRNWGKGRSSVSASELYANTRGPIGQEDAVKKQISEKRKKDNRILREGDRARRKVASVERRYEKSRKRPTRLRPARSRRRAPGSGRR